MSGAPEPFLFARPKSARDRLLERFGATVPVAPARPATTRERLETFFTRSRDEEASSEGAVVADALVEASIPICASPALDVHTGMIVDETAIGAAEPDLLGDAYRAFSRIVGQRTFYQAAHAWLSTLATTAARTGRWLRGDPSLPQFWGLDDAAPALRSWLLAHGAGSRYAIEVTASRTPLGLRHDRVVATPLEGGPSRVLDPWAGGEVDPRFDFDATLSPVARIVALARDQDEGRDAGAGVTGTELLDIEEALRHYGGLARNPPTLRA